jgi:hypothetical protein
VQTPASRIIHGDCLTELPKLTDNSVDAVVCDPPYSLSFMGKKWDTHESALAFQQWCEQWARECLRVLKPGGHLLAFGGTRTSHRITCGIEDAGFDVRDSIAWLYGSGFPKSLDVGKAIDKRPGVTRHAEFAADLCGAMKAKGYTNTFDVAEKVVGRRTGAVANWQKYQFPEAKWWPALRDLLDMDESKWGPLVAEAERVRTGQHKSGLLTGVSGVGGGGEGGDITAPATEAAKKWAGFGTAMKPSHEPIICARKPLGKGLTVAANVQAWGTGALNIDATRIGTSKNVPSSASSPHADVIGYGTRTALSERSGMDPNTGRWPANVVLDSGQSEVLDQMSGITSGGRFPGGKRPEGKGIYGGGKGLPLDTGHPEPIPMGDSGGASRFFLTIPDEGCRCSHDASKHEGSWCTMCAADCTLSADSLHERVLNEHRPVDWAFAGQRCTIDPEPWPCLSYRLAESLAEVFAPRSPDDPLDDLPARFLYTAKAPKKERPSYVKPVLRLREDLTSEQVDRVRARLAEAGVQVD